MSDSLKAAPPAAPGATELVDRAAGLGLGLTELRLAAEETWAETSPRETAYLLLRGEVEVEAGGLRVRQQRADPFAAPGAVVSVPPERAVAIRALSEAEVIRVETDNDASFEPRCYGPDDAFVDHRGRGVGEDAAYRLVRTYFDRRNAPEASRLVVGEVVNLPGRWSSYPPHHHPQPELYHYRFRPEHGYGHAEHGEEVFRVRHRDTLCITPGHDHAQCAAPGYAMLYVWTIRHLDDQPYDAPTFSPEHAAALDVEPWRSPETE